MEDFQGRKGGTDAGIWVTSFWMAEWRGLREKDLGSPWASDLGPDSWGGWLKGAPGQGML